MNYQKPWSFKESIQVGNMFWVFNGGKYLITKYAITVKVFESKLGSGSPRFSIVDVDALKNF